MSKTSVRHVWLRHVCHNMRHIIVLHQNFVLDVVCKAIEYMKFSVSLSEHCCYFLIPVFKYTNTQYWIFFWNFRDAAHFPHHKVYYPKVLTSHLDFIIFLQRHKQSHNSVCISSQASMPVNHTTKWFSIIQYITPRRHWWIRVPPFSKQEFAMSGGVSFNILTHSNHCHIVIVSISVQLCFFSHMFL